MEITAQIVQQITGLGGQDNAMAVFLQPSAWEELQIENPPQLDAQASPPTIFGLPIRVTTKANMEVRVVLGA